MRNCCNIWRNHFNPYSSYICEYPFFKVFLNKACVWVKELFFLMVFMKKNRGKTIFCILSGMCILWGNQTRFWFHGVLLRDGRYFERVKHDFLFLHKTQLLTFFQAISSGNWTPLYGLRWQSSYIQFWFCFYSLTKFITIWKYFTLILLSFSMVVTYLCVYVCVYIIFRIPSLHNIWIITHFFSNHWYAVLVLLYFMNS